MWGPGTCTVKAVPVKAHYVDHVGVTTQVTVNEADQAGPAPADWTNSAPYGASPSLAVGAGSLSLQETEPTGQGEIFYKVASSDSAYCSVVKGTGDVTANPAGADQDCDIQAWYAGNDNYNSSPKVTIATIAIEAGTLDTPTWGAFSGSLTVGGGSSNPFRNEPGRGDGGLYPQVQFRGQLPLAQYQHRTGGGEGGGKSRREDVHGGGEGQ